MNRTAVEPAAMRQRPCADSAANDRTMTGRGNAIRVGILGCSDIARRRFLPGVLNARNAVLVACSSRNIEKARRFFPGARYEPMGYDDLLSSAAIDVVYISLPNHLHEEWALRTLAQGKHVICEKPLGLSAASVAAMTAYAGQQFIFQF